MKLFFLGVVLGSFVVSSNIAYSSPGATGYLRPSANSVRGDKKCVKTEDKDKKSESKETCDKKKKKEDETQ